MSTFSSTSFPNPLVNFGKYKSTIGNDVRLQDLPEDYLTWLSKPVQGTNEPFILRGVNWTDLAKQELIRRKGGVPSRLGVEVAGPILPVTTVGAPDPPGRDNPLDLPTPPDHLKYDLSQVMQGLDDEHPPGSPAEVRGISDDAINDAVACLLKEWLQRMDKSQRFLVWLRQFSEEAARYGTLRGTTSDAKEIKHYGKYLFLMKHTAAGRLILLGVEPLPVEAS